MWRSDALEALRPIGPTEREVVVPLPNGAAIRRCYDLAGRLRSEARPDGTWLRYRYDAEGHPRSVEHSSGEWVDYEIADGGRTWRAHSAGVTTTLTLSADGFPVEVAQDVDGIRLAVAYERDDRGCASGWRYPDAHDWLRLDPDAPAAFVLRVGAVTYATLQGEEDGEQRRASVTWSSGTSVVEHLRPGARPEVHAVTVSSPGVGPAVTTTAEHRDGRIARLDGAAVRYDGTHLGACGSAAFAYDDAGRLIGTETATIRYGDAPTPTHRLDAGGTVRYEYDLLGRRIAAHGPAGTYRYHYDLFHQLVAVDLPDGGRVAYRYDGFGRLVARTASGDTRHWLVGVDGKRLVEADGDGAVTRSWLWLGEVCAARVDGPLGRPIAATFHRGIDGRVLAVGDAGGVVERGDAEGCFGAAPVADDRPCFAGLFGDPATGLLHAGCRWLDPTVGQFLTADPWFGEDAAGRVPRMLRRAVDALPGGTGHDLWPADGEHAAIAAYAWCGYDPLNATDPSGHNWLGLIFSTISALLWEMQLTSLSLQIQVVNVLAEILQLLILRPVWDTDGYWAHSVFNMAAPMASYRLMVPFALPLNGLLRFNDRGYTIGSVIWVRGDKWGDLADASHRTLVRCAEASTFTAATAEAAADVFMARNPNAVVAGTVDPANHDRIGSLTVTAPSGAGLGDVLRNGDWVAVRATGATTDELRTVSSTTGGTLRLDRDLPAPMGGQAVEIRRLDSAVVSLRTGSTSLARTVTFVRGGSVHFARQVPADFFAEGPIEVTELLPAGRRNRTDGTMTVEHLVVRMASAADVAGFATGDVVRIQSGGTLHARQVASVRAPTDVVLDAPLPSGAHTGMEVARLVPSGAALAGQTATGSRLTFATADLARRDGVAVENTGAATVTTERRVVTDVLVDLTVEPLPASLVGPAVSVDLLEPDAGTAAAGTVGTATEVTVPPADVARFAVGEPVQVRATSGGDPAPAVVSAVDAAGGRLTLTDALPSTVAAGTAVTVTVLRPVGAAGTFTADVVAAPGDHVVVHVPDSRAVAAGRLLRVRLTSATAGGAARRLAAAPGALAELDSALPGTHTTNLTVTRLTADPAAVRTGASAPPLRLRYTVSSGAVPYAVGDQLHLYNATGAAGRAEEAVAEVAAIDGSTVVLRDPVLAALATSVRADAVVGTGGRSTNGALGEGKVLVPSDPATDPRTRREAFEEHEMRHVWQGAVWGPFLVSLPIPWLVNLGFSFSPLAASGSKVVRHIGMGGLDSLFALAFWGIGGAHGSTSLDGTLDGDRRTVSVADGTPADAVAPFTPDSRIDVARVTEGGTGDEVFDVVDALDTSGNGSVRLRFPLDDGFSTGDRVRLTVSPYEQIRKTVSTWFSLNLEGLWHDHIPAAWGRALSNLLSRDAWFPGLGIYPMSLLVAGFDEDRLPNEQDAAYHSGDLYTSIVTSSPATAFVGQFTRVFAFIHARAGFLSERGPLTQLSVTLPTGVTADDVAGAVPGGTGVRFREQWLIPMVDDAENAVGAFFAASKPGTYRVRAPGDLPPGTEIVFKFAYDVSFLETSTIEVRALGLDPDPAVPIFETERVTYTITGDSTAAYALRFPAGAASPLGAISGVTYTAPALASAGTAAQDLEITATYSADHPVFRGPGQAPRDNLLAEQRTNLAQRITVTVEPITLPAVGPVAPGSTTEITVPIAPASATVQPVPATATGPASVVNLGGRPATLRFHAPAAVTAPTDVVLDLVFGADPAHRKATTLTIRVQP